MSTYGDSSGNYLKFMNFVDEIKAEFPKFELVKKEDSKFMKFLYAVTLMRFWNPYFREDYITTIFGKIYMPARLIGTGVGYDILRHERVHLRDARRFPVLFELSYILFPLPAVFTMRAYWEYRGYCESLLAEYDRYGYVSHGAIEYYVSLFAGPQYLWMCPFPDFMRNEFYRFLASRGIMVK